MKNLTIWTKRKKSCVRENILMFTPQVEKKMQLTSWTPDPKDCTLPWLFPSVISVISWTGHFVSLSVCFLLASPLLLATWTLVSEFWSQRPSEEQSWLASWCLVVILLDLQNDLPKMSRCGIDDFLLHYSHIIIVECYVYKPNNGNDSTDLSTMNFFSKWHGELVEWVHHVL